MISVSKPAIAQDTHLNAGAVIPAFNAGERIVDVLLKIQKFIPKKQILVVDDGSSDATAKMAQNAGVQVIHHPSNRGKGAALKTGFQKAVQLNLDAVFTLDADGQHDPQFIPAFLKTMREEDSDLVLGRRSFQIGKMPLDRILSNRLSSLVVSITAGEWIPDSQNGYRLIKRQVLEQVSAISKNYEFESEFLIYATLQRFKISHCPMSVIYNQSESHIHRVRDTLRFQKMIVRLSKEKIMRKQNS